VGDRTRMPAGRRRGAKEALAVRRARPSDREAILEMSKAIWGGTDYLPLVWDEWLNDAKGVLLTATYRGRPVGVSKISVLAPGEIWLEGLRLHPDLQGRGLVREINRVAFREALKLQPKTIRYSTGVGNAASRHLGEIRGFWQVARARWMWGSTDAHAGRRVRRAGLAEIDQVWSIVESSECRRLTSGLMATGWRFRTLDRRLARRLVAAGQCLVRPLRGSITTVALYDHGHIDRDPCLGFVAGPRRGAEAIARDALAAAAADGHGESTAMLPVGPLADTVRQAGYDAELATEAVVYELGARGMQKDDEPFENVMARTLRRREDEATDLLTDFLAEAAPQRLARENIRDFVRRTMIPETRRRLYGTLRPVTDRLGTYELRGNMRAVIDILIDRFGIAEEDVRIGATGASFRLGGRGTARITAGPRSLRLTVGPGFGPLFPATTRFGAGKQVFDERTRDSSSRRYGAVTLSLSDPAHIRGAERALAMAARKAFGRR